MRLNSFMTESLSNRNQSIDLQSKSMDWFLYDRDLRHEKVNTRQQFSQKKLQLKPFVSNAHLRFSVFSW